MPHLDPTLVRQPPVADYFCVTQTNSSSAGCLFAAGEPVVLQSVGRLEDHDQ